MPAAALQRESSESFGRRLRRERERRQIAIASIAENTKISVSLFEELERDDATRWPSGIFRRSFIRAYASAIGLDPDELAKEFLERFPDPNEIDPFGRVAPPSPADTRPLRLTLADTNAFTRHALLSSVRQRLFAAGCDLLCVSLIAAVIYLVVGLLWIPFVLALVGYYAGSILLLGNTPGVCLCAPRRRGGLSLVVKSAPPALMLALTRRDSELQTAPNRDH